MTAARTLRSISPLPATLPLADVRRLNAVRERLLLALRTADTLGALRSDVATLASDMQDLSGLTEEDHSAPTQRMPVSHRPWDDDAAPATSRDTELGREFGV